MKSNNQTRTIGNNVTGKRNASVKLRDVAKLVTSPIKKHHTPNDEIYLKPIRFSCPFCIKTGTPKAYKNLWKLRYHFRDQHDFSYSCQNLIATLENLVERKVLL